ncbi:hypothetical protein [Yersinia massiliensis]|uniref:hypothetical protein n=1 Tax=Yersinia massiliensis TaxID=419257 RepID=UPI000C158CAF|nr:hypothetical protein [Yersinia massiliensis]PHZ22229.1 hypothetical protein CS535_18170 [Yersinia massiliensis]
MSENTDYETLKAERDAAMAQVWRLVGENVVMKQIIDSVTDLDNEPKYHSEGMGFGLEDRGITDRYDAMQHCWECAMDRVYGEVIPCAEELDFTATDAALNEIKAQGVMEFATSRAAFLSGYEHAEKFAASLRGEQNA